MADIKIYGKLVNATESGKIANYSQIDGTPDIIEVEANPTGSGTENLTRLKVGDIVYNVPQGGTALNLENGEGEGSLSQIYLQGGKNINKAESQGSIALGYGVTVQKSSVTNETGFCGYAEGGGTITEGQFGHAEGEMTKALARGSHSEGKKTEALGMYCHVEGSENIAGFEDISKEYGDQAAHAEGMLNKAKGRYSHAEGKNNIVGNGSGNGESSHAEGENNTVMGNFSHVEGYNNTVNGNYTHVEGSGNSVSATTNNGHVEGFKNTISSNYGHVGGLSSEVSGTGAFAHGNGVKANKYFQTVFGQFNNPDAIDAGQTAIFQVGVGKSEDARTNAFEILYDGRAKVLTAPKSENDVVRKKELDKKLTAPATPTANSVVTISADGTVATKLLSEIGGGGGTSTSYVVNNLSSISSIPSTERRAVYVGGNATSTTAITIPTTVNEIDFNGSTITLEVGNSAEFDVGIIGHAHCTIKNLNLIVNLHLNYEVNYSMIKGFGGVENVRVTINKAADAATAAPGQIVRGFYSCDHLVNCKVEHKYTTSNFAPQTVAYSYCNYLVWCRLSGYTTFGFAECNYLTNCAVYKGVAESPYYNCNDLTNCTYYEGENQISKSTVSKLTVGGSPLDIIPQFNSGSNSKAYVKPAGGTGIALIEISQSQEDSLSIARRTSDGRLRGKRAKSGYDLTPLVQVNEELAKKIDKVEGQGLSTNDFTTDEKTKLAGIEAGAEVNEIDTITPGSNITVTKNGKEVIISATGGGGGGVNVVQTTGQSTTDVMSQKAVTDKLDGKASTSYVQGNPTASGTVDLTRLKVGNTVYNVPHGIKALKVTIW